MGPVERAMRRRVNLDSAESAAIYRLSQYSEFPFSKPPKTVMHGAVYRSEIKDVKCYAEHFLCGGTSLVVSEPWIPYALLAGTMTVEQVNLRRQECSVSSKGCDLAICAMNYGLTPWNMMFFAKMTPVNAKNKKVSPPQIIRARYADTEEFAPQSLVEKLKYNGPRTFDEFLEASLLSRLYFADPDKFGN